MSPRQKARIIVLPILLALLFISLKYTMQPVDLYTLMPDLEIERIEVDGIYNGEGGNAESFDLLLESGTPEFDEILSRLEGLRFNRSAWSPVFQALPFLADLGQADAKQVEDGESTHLYIILSQESANRTEELDFWVDKWSYRDLDHDISLELSMSDGKEIGQTLGRDLLQMAQEIESNS